MKVQSIVRPPVMTSKDQEFENLLRRAAELRIVAALIAAHNLIPKKIVRQPEFRRPDHLFLLAPIRKMRLERESPQLLSLFSGASRQDRDLSDHRIKRASGGAEQLPMRS